MSGGMYLAAAGALVQQLRLEVLSNNLANINTVGYKSERSLFQIPEEPDPQVFETPIEAVQSLSPYAPPFTTEIDFSQGGIRQTGNALDLAINGDGFFSIQTPDGVQYTRQGSFTLDGEGVLVTSDGYPVLGEGGEITLEEGTVEIDTEGAVYVNGDEVGRLQITDFLDRGGLKKAGNGRFIASETAVPAERPERTTVSQGVLEGANVNPVRAMTEMIETSRAFEAYQKVIQTADEATAKSINDVGKTA
ncbi:flagellar basal-body rod protein FlgF [Desulfosarcina alkanivorans]|uniref:Flagellar basal-body rod protein FlgF n=1 Tax=Desulfosarcina alkanivorans TaxID=571177 RepID=A0A5K7YG82_9BACT|nr:flagellar basal-body rod protein FlgF [Desulfosarcina alkanivorans]BBO66779.1 flagellar basal-body rod protein FlgF [Desulfosarcina alkanivorans]